MKKTSILLSFLLFFSALALAHCDKTEERVARYPLSLRKDASKKAKRITWISKAEKVKLLEPVTGTFAKVRLASGEEGYVESRHLALEAIVLTTDEITLKQRPSESSGASYSAKNVRKAGVAFVMERMKNEEGGWLKITGGSGQKTAFPYFQGWIKRDSGYNSSVSLVQSALELEKAVKKKDLEALRKLANASEPVSEVAAAKVVELEGVSEETLEQDTEVAPEDSTQDTSNESSNSSETAPQESPAATP